MRKTITLTDEQEEMMRDACTRSAPDEACGVIAGGVCYELTNFSEASGTFHISAEELGPIAERHGGYEGIWHTHPSGNPFPSDDDWAYHPSSKALVVATRTQVMVHYAGSES